MNPVVRLHKLPSNWTELKEAELQNNSNLPSTVSPVSTVWRSQEFRDRFGMIQSRNISKFLAKSRRSTGASASGAASTSTEARPKKVPTRIVYDVDRNWRRK